MSVENHFGPLPWSFDGMGDTTAIRDNADNIILEIPYVEEAGKEAHETKSVKLAAFLVDAVNNHAALVAAIMAAAEHLPEGSAADLLCAGALAKASI